MEERHELREQVLEQIRAERRRQLEMYGTNDDLELGFNGKWLWPLNGADAEQISRTLRAEYEQHEGKTGRPTWMHLIREEVAELFEATTNEDRITEAVQVASLCVSLVEHLKRYGDLNLEMSPQNLALIIRAYDDGDGGNLDLRQRMDGWVEGTFGGDLIYEGVEIEGILYSIAHMGDGMVAVSVGDDLLRSDGLWFETTAEARAYIMGLTAK